MIITETRKYNGHNIATALHYAGSKNIVIFCHGYRGSSIGPSRFFVRTAHGLADSGISSLRFDQFGSGNSEGDFYDSSFTDWVATTEDIVKNYQGQGYRVGLMGQSMGGAAVISAGAKLSNLVSIVAWVPDPNIEDFVWPDSGYIEESGQRVQAIYWQEAHDAKVADKLQAIEAPAYIVQCSEDVYVDKQNRNAMLENARTNHLVENFEGYTHSKWTYEQAENIIAKSVNFIAKSFEK